MSVRVARRIRAVRVVPTLVLASVVLIASGAAVAQVAMPDPTEMAGRAIPAPELPDGTVSVRLVRQQLGNNLVGHDVTVVSEGVSRTAKTDETGRATFTGLAGHGQATAEASVDGERVVSRPFDVPQGGGGLRVILIAGIAELLERRRQEEAEAAAAPPVRGAVVFGGDSRIILEFQDDSLRAFYLLEIVNTARTRVDTGGPLIIDLPRGAAGATLMQGSFPGASVSGDRVTIRGPFPPGRTPVQIAFRVLYTGSQAALTQKLPANLEKISVVLEKVGDVHLASPQFADHGDVRAADGTPFVLGTGGALPAGSDLVLHLNGLPNDSTWPRDIALGLAAAIFAIGGWLAFGGGRGGDERRQLTARRETLYRQLVELEEQQRAGRLDLAAYDARRHRLIAELERIYGELDDAPDAGRAA